MNRTGNCTKPIPRTPESDALQKRLYAQSAFYSGGKMVYADVMATLEIGRSSAVDYVRGLRPIPAFRFKAVEKLLHRFERDLNPYAQTSEPSSSAYSLNP